MPKDWKIPEQVRTVFGDTPKVVITMPSSTSLGRPMLTPSYLKVHNYPIKKIEIFEAETGVHRHPKNIHYIAIHPIEANYTLVLSGYGEGLPLPFQNIFDVKLIPPNNIEFDLVGTGTIGINNIEYVARIKTDEKYANQVYEHIKGLKALENSGTYWRRESLTFQALGGSKKTVEIYSQTPFLGINLNQ